MPTVVTGEIKAEGTEVLFTGRQVPRTGDAPVQAFRVPGGRLPSFAELYCR
jgi:hypothetical protein